MIKNKKILERFEIELLKNEKLNYERNLKIFSELHKFSKHLNKFRFEFLEDIENDIKYAFAINGIKRTFKKYSKGT